LAELGVADRPADWPQALNLHASDLAQQQLERLREQVYRTLLLSAAMRTKAALMAKANLKFAPQEFRAVLELLALARSYRPASPTASALERFCLKVVGEKPAQRPSDRDDSAVDLFFLGIAHYWIHVASQDPLSRAITETMTRSMDLDVKDPRATSEALLRSAVARDANHYWSQFWLGWTLLNNGDLRSAELALNTCAILRPDYATSYAERAPCLIQQRQRQWPHYWTSLGELFLAGSLGAVRSTPLLFRQSEFMQPHVAALFRGRDERIDRDLHRALELSPAESWIHTLRALAFAGIGQKANVLNSWARMLELERPLEVWKGQRVYGDKQVILEQAARHALALARAEPAQGMALTVYATARLSQGKLAEAGIAAERALQLDPHLPQALAVRGALALQARQPQSAMADFTAALEHDCRNLLAARDRAQALEALGKAEQALEALDRLLELAPTDWHGFETRLDRARNYLALQRPAEALADSIQAAEQAGTKRQRLAGYLGQARALAAHGQANKARAAPAPGSRHRQRCCPQPRQRNHPRGASVN
jgi:tetratricopeptide (TPR) repeat protein